MSSSDAIRDLISRHNQVRRECQEIDTRVKAQNRQYWNNRVGPVSDVLSQSRDEAEKCLHHSDAAIRSAALNALFYDHKAVSDPSFVRSCERLAFKDPDPEVRANALGFMAFFHQASSDLRIGRLLAEVVCDESLHAEVRRAAYSSLFALWGERNSDLESFLHLRFPEDVDWRLVARVGSGELPALRVDQVAFLDPSISEDQRAAFVSLRQGVQALTAADYDTAVVRFSEVIDRLPYEEGGYLMRGRAYAHMNSLDEAIADFTQAIQLNPESASAFRGRGEAYKAKGLIDLAESDFQAAIAVEAEQET